MPNRTPPRFVIVFSLLVGAGGCTVERSVHLYPANIGASATGVLSGQIIGHGDGHGTASVDLPDGERLEGEYSIVFGGSVGFGSIFTTVYGRGGSLSSAGTSTDLTMAGSGQGSASLFGSRGTSAQCEFLNNNMTGHGYGVCQLSSGGVYRLQY